jgi:non-specific serine/threonine protein kinase
MLATVREYALEHLRAAGEEAPLQRRHVDFYVAFAEQAEPHLLNREQSVWLTRLEAERDNLRAAFAFAVEQADTETALRLASASRRFWHLHAHLAEGRAWLDAALNLRETAPSVLRVKALNGAGTLAARQGDLAAAERLISESLELAEELGERQRAAIALNNLANLRLSRNNQEEAEMLYRQSAELAREVRDQRLEAVAVENLGSLKLIRGDVSRARILLEQAGELAFAAGDPRDVSSIERSLARVQLAEGRHDIARSLLADALRVSRDLGLKIELAESLELGAEVAAGSGDVHACARLLGAADSLRASIGAPREPPYDDFWCERTAAKARELLSDLAFNEAYEQGLALQTEEAIELALDQTSSSPVSLASSKAKP